ncbi:MBL fold metallo-hydrolase [Candidatus Neomarinimicrobiota bacterium]
MQVEVVVTGSFEANAYLVWEEGSTQAVTIDPGDDADHLIKHIERHNLRLGAILVTHAHLDHVGAVQALRDWSKAPVCLPEKEREVLSWLPESYSYFGLPSRPVPTVDHWLNSQVCDLSQVIPHLQLGGLKLEVHDTPGHSPGGVCYAIENQWFVGDTLFQGSVGRVDLPGGSWSVLQETLRYLSKQPDEVVVWPGHGPRTTIGHEKRTNPFLKDLD